MILRDVHIKGSYNTLQLQYDLLIFIVSRDIYISSHSLKQNLSRKLVHIMSGLLFMASWPIFRYYYVLSLMIANPSLNVVTDDLVLRLAHQDGLATLLL